MKRLTKLSLVLSIALAFVASCTDKYDYYDRPSWLEPPIYEVLKKEGRFTNYLKCVDRTLYAPALKSSGLYTIFAPNDDAFAAFLTSKGYNSVDAIPDSLVNQLVSYSIVYNNYTYNHLSDILSGGWDSLASIRKKTTYYKSIYRKEYQNDSIWVYDMPGLSASLGTTVEQNFKYVPLYLKNVFESNRTPAQAAADYGMFYSTPYTGENIQSATVKTKDMMAENGVIHEIDNVLEPLPNLENILNNESDFSKFNSLINMKGSTGAYYFINYTYNSMLTEYYRTAFPNKNIDKVYFKYYNGLTFNLGGERYGTSMSDSEKGGFTVFAPNNTAVDKFYNEKLKDYFPNGIETVSSEALNYFITAQMVDELVWPGDYKGSMNSLGEFLNGKGNRGDEFDQSKYSKLTPASNGLFYGSNDYIKSRYFETVFTDILLSPSNTLLNSAFKEYFETTLKEELLKCELNGYTQENYTVLLPSDELLAADGFYWTWLSASNKYGFAHTYSGSAQGSFDVATRIQRLVRSHIFKRIKNEQVNCAITNFVVDPAFATAYNGYAYAVNEYGDMIRYKNNEIQMLGNVDENEVVKATPYKTFLNGQIFKIDKMLQYSRRKTYPTTVDGYKSQDLYTYILTMTSGTQNTNVALFKNYIAACLKGDGSNELAGISADMTLTIFMPTNAAITKAISNGDLPSLTSVNADAAARQKATKFVLYHFVKGKVFVDDGLPYIMPNNEVIKEETWPTVLKDVVDNTYLAIRKSDTGTLLVSTYAESTGRPLSTSNKTATVTRGIKRSNYFAAKAVMHEINDYLKYEKVQ